MNEDLRLNLQRHLGTEKKAVNLDRSQMMTTLRDNFDGDKTFADKAVSNDRPWLQMSPYKPRTADDKLVQSLKMAPKAEMVTLRSHFELFKKTQTGISVLSTIQNLNVELLRCHFCIGG